MVDLVNFIFLKKSRIITNKNKDFIMLILSFRAEKSWSETSQEDVGWTLFPWIGWGHIKMPRYKVEKNEP